MKIGQKARLTINGNHGNTRMTAELTAKNEANGELTFLQVTANPIKVELVIDANGNTFDGTSPVQIKAL